MKRGKSLIKKTLEVALVVSCAFGMADNQALALEPTLGEESAYTIENGSEDSYNIIIYLINSEGKLIPNYYKYNLNSNIQSLERINGNSSIVNPNGTFYNLSADDNRYGGAINVNYGKNLGNITADFLQNKADYGGAIYVYSGTINKITGDFIGNYSSGVNSYSGGAIGLRGGGYPTQIGSIVGNFINNYVSNNTSAAGGAISNATGGIVRDIQGDFIGNYVSSGGLVANNATGRDAGGGAIYNEGTFGDIRANFFNNSTQAVSFAYGGAISNFGTINNIQGSFINNIATTESTIAYALGGAIYTIYPIIINANNTISLFSGNLTIDRRGTIPNAIFINTQEGATLTLNATNTGTIKFDDQIDGGTIEGSGLSERTIKRSKQYNLKIQGDDTSKVVLNNSVINANASLNDTNLYMSETAFADSTTNLNTNSGTVQLANGTSENYQINRLTSSENANYTVDVDLTKLAPVPDTITTGASSSGTVTISDINFNGELKEFNTQILKAQNDNIQLGLSDELKEKYNKTTEETITSTDTVTPTVNWKDTFNKYEQTNTTTTGLELSTTNTTNDSIEFSTQTEEGEIIVSSLGDTLALLNQLETPEVRNFNFDTAKDIYIVKSDLGSTSAGILNINGVYADNNRSTIQLNGYSGFNLVHGTRLNLNNVKYIGDIFVGYNSNDETPQNSVVSLINTEIDGDIGHNMLWEYDLYITGANTDTTILNGSVKNAVATLTNSVLKFNPNSFQYATLNAESGTVDFLDQEINNYIIGVLNSKSDVDYKLDIDLSKETPVADILEVNSKANEISSGTVTISDINFNGELKEFNAQILKAQDSNIQLGLSDELKEKYNKTTEETITSTDTVIPTVNWKDTFNKYEQTNTTTTGLELSTTNTTNDSIEFSTKTTEGEKTVTGTMGDTLALVNQLQTTEERNFNFDTAEDKYTVNSDLGQTTAGKLNINGVKSENSSSTVDLNGHSGFELANKSTLVVNNAKLTGSDNLITVTNSDAVVELNNAYIDGNINGDKNYNININGADTTTINGNVTSANATLNNGTLKFNSNTFAANTNTLNVNSGTVSLADNNTESYNINNLNSNANGNYTIDIDAQNQTADVLNIGTNSTGTVTISDINFINSVPSDTFKVQILNTQSDAVQLALNKELSENSYNLGTTSRTLYDTVTSTVNYKDIFNTYTQTGTVYGSLELAATNTINDSIALAVKDTVWNDDKTVSGTMGDTLALLNQLQTEEDRHFNFDTAEDKYNVTEDLGQTSAGTLNINGVAENGNRSEINLNSNSGFELTNNSTLNINNTKLTGNETLINVSNPEAVVNLQNSHIDGNISSSTEYGLNISGNQNDTTVINGNAGRANTTLSGSNLEFNTNTFKDASLNTRSGTVNFQNENISDYNIGKLTSSSAANYKFDIDLSGETASADKLIVGNGSSGIVTVSAIDFINGAVPDKEFIVQLIDSDSNAIQLALNSEISGQNIELGTVSKTVYDTITPTVKWNDVFNYYSQKGINYGNIGLATTETANDSLALTVTNTVWEDKTYQGSMGDTLALVNQLETKEDRNFNFETSEDVYEVSSDLGTTSKGTLNINGVSSETGRSTLNANSLALFVLDNETKLNLNNVKITNANNVVSGTNKDAVVNINNSEISNNTNGITTAGSVNISGNSVIENNGNGINVTSDTSVITLTGGIDGEITLRDKLTGVAGAKLNISGGTINFEKKVSALDIMMERANVNVSSDDLFDGNNMTVNSASNLNMANNTVGTMHLNNLTLNDNLNMSVDVDLANKSMDRLTADSYNLGDNNVNVSNMNLLTSTDRYKTDILFADEGLRNNVTTSISEVAYSPIYKYNVAYEKNTGNFTFTRPGVTPPTPDNPNPEGGNNYDSYNPAVMASPVSSQLGGYMAMLDTYNNAFTHMDMYMLKPSTIRLAEQKANRYALTETLGVEYNSNEMNSKGMWYRPYASYDSVGLKNGPDVDNFSYGTFIGGDTEMFKTKHGFWGVVSPYIAYQGAHQSYSGNSIYQNGGTLGATATFYKGNFFTGLTAGVGMNISEASTMYGNENFPMLMAGIANKTGYNFEFKDGRYIVQPNLMLSYTFVNAFDYTNGAGVKINSDPLHAIQVAPNVRFIMNTQNGWQPYAAFGMHWNIMDDTNVTANTTSLPELSLKPYFSYGLGIQRVFKDRFTAYAQIMLRNGGRNGIAASFGGRYMLGKESGSEKQQNSL